MEAKAYYRFLLDRYFEGTATAAEVEELFAELGKNTDDAEWQAMISELHAATAADPQYNAAEWDGVADSILHPVTEAPLRKVPAIRRWAAAAAVLLLVTAGGYYFMQRPRTLPAPANAVVVAADVKPGKNGAILRLANGQQVVLDSLGNGIVSTQQGTQVLLHNGQLVYNASGAGTPEMNVMSTPRGRKFRLQLPDGTNVWLNAASSIAFPTAFSGTERKVELTGEAYFEVAKHKTMPFIVKINEQTSVEVLGTHFNISSYTDEHTISTTLMEGAVRVKMQDRPSILKPGQQLMIDQQAGTATLNKNVDTLAVVAWKNGILNFQDKKLTTIMGMIARWYDIEIIYATTPPDVTFIGEIGSDVNLSSVLTFLRESGIHFTLEDRKLIIGK